MTRANTDPAHFNVGEYYSTRSRARGNFRPSVINVSWRVGMGRFREPPKRRRGLPPHRSRWQRTDPAEPIAQRLGAEAASAAAAGLLLGAALAFFLDPHSGRRRRKLVVDRTRASVRRRRRAVERQVHYDTGKV